MLTPIALVQAVIDGMIARKFGRIVNITSMSVKMPIPMLDLSSGARIGLTGFLAGVARQVAADNVTINNLLPGAIDTDRITALDTKIAETTGRDYAEARARRERSIAARRLGTTEEFGAACAFLCSRQASYITGQSILIDVVAARSTKAKPRSSMKARNPARSSSISRTMPPPSTPRKRARSTARA
jgi:3-oxoacyl-[acyl-carrier protein] reductase